MNQPNQSMNQNQPQPLSDQELAFDLLYQEKALLTNMASEVLEASHPGMRQVMNDCSMQISQDQLALFNRCSSRAGIPPSPPSPRTCRRPSRSISRCGPPCKARLKTDGTR